MRLLRIMLPYATFGVVLGEQDGKIIETAPIAKWMIGKTEAEIRAWVAKKRGSMETVSVPPEEESMGT